MTHQEIYDQHHAELMESESVKAGMYDRDEYGSLAESVSERAAALAEQSIFYGVDE